MQRHGCRKLTRVSPEVQFTTVGVQGAKAVRGRREEMWLERQVNCLLRYLMCHVAVSSGKLYVLRRHTSDLNLRQFSCSNVEDGFGGGQDWQRQTVRRLWNSPSK